MAGFIVGCDFSTIKRRMNMERKREVREGELGGDREGRPGKTIH